MGDDSRYEHQVKDLDKVETISLCQVLADGLKNNFSKVHVEEVECPDLRQKPWTLATEGLCGSPKLLDVGGPPYFVPMVQRDKIYNFDRLASCIDNENAYFLGAGAAGSHILGCNAEMMANVRVGAKEDIQTYVAKVDEKDKCDLLKFQEKEFCLLGNFLACHGQPGKVIKINAKVRQGKENFIECIRNILNKSYPDQFIGLGGVFVMKSGKARLHVMPDFSCTPLQTDDDVNNWLNFYEMSAPLVCLSVFYNKDPGYDLRIEHTHCFSSHGEGGHYHYDTTPEDVEYEGYFIQAEQLYRFDKPEVTHTLARD